jgi:hypothetical protein
MQTNAQWKKALCACLEIGKEREDNYKGGVSKLWEMIELYIILTMVMVS